ncbi:MAG: hypothetical protein KDD47_27830, partial [Acidobacteria bacterium]|nr:hypothetical protein [Acidobacteriota bacterium]
MRHLLFLASTLLSAAPLLSQQEACSYSPLHTPAAGAAPQLWGELEPSDHGVLPPDRDTTDFDQLGDFEPHPYWMSLDVEAGWVFAAANRRLQIWDARSSPSSPVRTFDRGFRDLGLTWTPDAHAFFIFEDLDAPPGVDQVLALTGRYGVGLAVYDTSSKSSPQLHYQDHGNGRWGTSVWATTIAGRHYAVLGANQTSAGGAFLYDLSQAQLFSNCREDQPSQTRCPGVFLGRIGSRPRVAAVDGDGPFVALASGTAPGGFEIWDLSQPSAPRRRMEALTTQPISSLALWGQGSVYYLAVRLTSALQVFDVTCVTSGNCTLGSPLASLALPATGAGTLTFSRAGDATPFLFAGTTADCLTGLQHEWLWDVSSPTSPRDVTPPQTPIIRGRQISYWGWYYRDNDPHGFNHVAPRVGKLHGDHFYRAGLAIFDVHRWIAAPLP